MSAPIVPSPSLTFSLIALRFVTATFRSCTAPRKPPSSPSATSAPSAPRPPATRSDTSRRFRDVSDRVAGGRGALGALVADGDDGGLRGAVQDLKVAVTNLKAISEKVKDGEGTIGALIADPTIYERLVTILEGAERSFLLRSLIRGLGEQGAESKGDRTRR